MRFAIAPIEYWIQHGYDPEHWRQSPDGKLAMCHLEFGEVLAPNLTEENHVRVYDIKDTEFQKVLREEFTEQNEVAEDPEEK